MPKALHRKLQGNLIWIRIHFNSEGFFYGKNRFVFMLFVFVCPALMSSIQSSAWSIHPPSQPCRIETLGDTKVLVLPTKN